MERIGVVGGGTMGAGIADVCAAPGASVVVVEANGGSAERSRDRIGASLQRAVRAGRLDQVEAERAPSAVDVVTELAATATAELVIEAVPDISCWC